jgi:hypothetical protein
LRQTGAPTNNIHMSVYIRVVLVVLVLVIGGGIAFLLTWDIPPPTSPIEKTLPDDRFEQ